MRSKYKAGDVTEDGWEVVEIYQRPVTKVRKRIRLIREWGHAKVGELGWHYRHDVYEEVTLDCYPDTFPRVSTYNFEYI